jgi:hypothetical protein
VLNLTRDFTELVLVRLALAREAAGSGLSKLENII